MTHKNPFQAEWLSPRKAVAAGGIVGIAIFILLYGFKIVDPTYTAWLMAEGGDMSQSYMGWQFYRASGWHFPIGLIDGIIYPNLISVMYIDSIPLFGLIFKLLSPLLPGGFQYFGIWGVVCFMLQGGMAALLVWKYNKRVLVCAVCPVFFVLSPMVLNRLYGHTALAGQWILLAAMAVWVYRQQIGSTKRMLAAWAGLFFISPLIHSYFTGMLAFMLMGFLLLDFIELRDIKRSLAILLGSGLALFASMYLIGAFHGSIAVDEGGAGEYGLNLLWFANPKYGSAFINTIPYARSGQYEGFSYMGLGLLALMPLAVGVYIYSFIKRRKPAQHDNTGFLYAHRLAISTTITAAMLLTYAVLPVVSVAGRTLFTVPLPGLLGDLWNTFRATGRFVWPVWYWLCYVLLVYVSTWPKKALANTLLVAALCLQAADLRPMLTEIHLRFAERKTYTSTMSTPEWNAVAACVEHIVFIDPFIFGDSHSFPALNDIGDFAIQHGLTVNNYHLSRHNDKQVEAELARQMANPDPDTLYFAPNISDEYPQNAELHYFGDRLVVLFPNSNERLKAVVGKTPPVEILETPDIAGPTPDSTDAGELSLSEGEEFALPYGSLPAGKYMIDWRGSNMQGYSFEIYNFQDKVECEIVKSRFGMATIFFELDNPSDTVVFRAINNNGFNTSLYSVILARVE